MIKFIKNHVIGRYPDSGRSDCAVALANSCCSSLRTVAFSASELALGKSVRSKPLRKRTSIVTFDAVGGTTYAIAVDGWGNSSQGDVSNYYGMITLKRTPRSPSII